jgi:AGCS family alanine or glycine:cation symporter
MQDVNEFLKIIDGYIGGSDLFVYFLLGTGLFFTLYLKFPQIRYFRHAIKVVKGKFDKKGDPGDTSHFQALTTALSGTVGTGNIAGVALAIHLGGPAALFWMLITAMLGMTTKFVEVTLSHKYRETDSSGYITGGPMYYMKNKLNMKWLAVIFAIATVFSTFGTGSLPQINSISNSMFATFGITHWITGAVLAVLLGIVIVGGIKRIAKVTERLVPAMAVVYFIGAFLVIIYNYENIIPSLISVFSDVFTGSAATGGFLGAGFAYAFNRGVNRGLFSNEAGQGSAPIAHAAARTEQPVSEGLVAILEPFIDTIIICSLTGLVLLSSGVWNKKYENRFQEADMEILADIYDENNLQDKEKLYAYLNNNSDLELFTGELKVVNGTVQNQLTIIHARSLAEQVKVYSGENLFSGSLNIDNGKLEMKEENREETGEIIFEGKSLLHSAPLTTVAFTKSFIGDWGQYIVSIGLLLFAFSTAISWSYYGGRAMTYLFGSHVVIYYRIFYIIAFFFASFIDTTIIWTLSGITIAFMTIPNLLGILLLRRDMKSTVKKYWSDFKKEHPEVKIPE